MIRATEYGSTCLPAAANVAYPLAMRIALGVALPRDIAGTCGPKLEGSRPARWAVSRTVSRPVSMPSCMNGVFTDRASARPRPIRP